jgi:hypothetical protein
VLLRTIVAVGGFAVLHYLAALLGDNLIFPATPLFGPHPPRPRRRARDLAALLGGQFLRPSFAAETRKLGSVPGK